LFFFLQDNYLLFVFRGNYLLLFVTKLRVKEFFSQRKIVTK